MTYRTYWFLLKGYPHPIEVVAISPEAARADLAEAFHGEVLTWGSK